MVAKTPAKGKVIFHKGILYKPGKKMIFESEAECVRYGTDLVEYNEAAEKVKEEAEFDEVELLVKKAMDAQKAEAKAAADGQ